MGEEAFLQKPALSEVRHTVPHEMALSAAATKLWSSFLKEVMFVLSLQALCEKCQKLNFIPEGLWIDEKAMVFYFIWTCLNIIYDMKCLWLDFIFVSGLGYLLW